MQQILGIGIDSVEIERFTGWHTYSHKSLRRIFSETEIAYCLATPAKSAERFAARFATREAFLKALHLAMPQYKTHLLTVCKAVQIFTSANRAPHMIIDWKLLNRQDSPAINCLVSWTHTKVTATAIVLINK